MSPIPIRPAPAKTGPFGNPDASRASALEDYISVPGASLDLREAKKLHQRVIIGKKGAGKTFYLKTLQRTIQSSQLEWYVWVETNRLQSNFVQELTKDARARHAGLLAKGFLIDSRTQSREFWVSCWEKALIYCAYRIIVSNVDESQLRGHDALDEIAPFIKRFVKTSSPITAIKSIAKACSQSTSEMLRLFNDPAWDILYEFANKNVDQMRPIAIFIDAIDDHFDAAPDAWLDCQHGLFRVIFSFLNKADALSNRFHVIATLREVAFSSLRTSEHAVRYLTDSHVAYITWNEQAAHEFFRQKLTALVGSGDLQLSEAESVNPVIRWLGFDKIENGATKREEWVSDYILRHTRLLPRDIVLMGNEIAAQVEVRLSQGRKFSAGKLRQTVSATARQLAADSVYNSANEYIASFDYVPGILSDEQLRGLEEAEAAKIEAVIMEIKVAVGEQIRQLFQRLGREFFSYADLKLAIKSAALAPVRGYSDQSFYFSIENILFRQGLISFQTHEGGSLKWVSTWRHAPHNDDSHLPSDALLYRMHPIVFDLVPEIERNIAKV